MATLSKAWLCDLSLARIAGSNPVRDMDVRPLWGTCVGLINRPEESYWEWCVWVWSWILPGTLRAVSQWNKRGGWRALKHRMCQSVAVRGKLNGNIPCHWGHCLASSCNYTSSKTISLSSALILFAVSFWTLNMATSHNVLMSKFCIYIFFSARATWESRHNFDLNAV